MNGVFKTESSVGSPSIATPRTVVAHPTVAHSERGPFCAGVRSDASHSWFQEPDTIVERIRERHEHQLPRLTRHDPINSIGLASAPAWQIRTGICQLYFHTAGACRLEILHALVNALLQSQNPGGHAEWRRRRGS